MKKLVSIPLAALDRENAATFNLLQLEGKRARLLVAIEDQSFNPFNVANLQAQLEIVDADISDAEIELNAAQVALSAYGAVDMTEEEEDQFEQSRSFLGFTTKADALADIRWKKEVGGVVVDGIPVPSDRDSQSKFIAGRIKAVENSAYTVEWYMPSLQSFISITAPVMIVIADAVAAHVKKCFSAQRVILEDAISYSSYDGIASSFLAAYLSQPEDTESPKWRITYGVDGDITVEEIEYA